MKKYTLFLIAITILGVGAYGTELLFLESRATPNTQVAAVIASSSSPQEVTSTPITPSPVSTTSHQEVIATSSATQTPNVTVTVSGTSYGAYVPADTTVLDVMRILASTTSFTFSGKEYPSLGMFVESINGKTAERGYVWIFYVNGKEAQKGISQLFISPGDSVEWKYEKSH